MADKKKGKITSIVRTAGVQARCDSDSAFSHFAFRSLYAFLDNDWGDICEEDKQVNETALKFGSRLLGSYTHTDGTRLWVIADPEDENKNRVVTILFPEEY